MFVTALCRQGMALTVGNLKDVAVNATESWQKGTSSTVTGQQITVRAFIFWVLYEETAIESIRGASQCHLSLLGLSLKARG